MTTKITPIQKLDFILLELNDMKPHGIGGVQTNLRLLHHVHYEIEELLSAFKKLVKDGYVHTGPNNFFSLSIDGAVFIGYEKTRIFKRGGNYNFTK